MIDWVVRTLEVVSPGRRLDVGDPRFELNARALSIPVYDGIPRSQLGRISTSDKRHFRPIRQRNADFGQQPDETRRLRRVSYASARRKAAAGEVETENRCDEARVDE